MIIKIKKSKNKIGHSSRSSSIQRSKTTIEKRWTKDKETDGKKTSLDFNYVKPCLDLVQL